MGANVQFDNYYSMRDLNHDSNGTSWPLHRVENNLPNGQYHYNVLPRATPELSPGVDKELVKQTMLEHEDVFRNQVIELHRLYKVQKDLMDELQKKGQFKHRTPLEVSSSSSPFPSQMTPEDAHRRNSSSFLFTNGVCGGPPASHPENIRSSADGSIKGKNAHCASPKNSEVSDSRPSKLRKVIDLELPAEEYMDTDEIEQCGNGMTNDSGEKSFPSHCENMKPGLADLNEPLECEEAPGVAEVVSWKPEHGNINGTRNNSHFSDKGNGQNWFLSALKPEESKDNGKFYPSRPEQVVFDNRQQPPGFFPPHHVNQDSWPVKANDSFKTVEKGRSLSGFSNLEGLVASHQPSYGPYSNLVNSWDNSWRKPSNYLNHKSQSSVPSNGFLEFWWCRNEQPRSNPVRNGFYHGSSSSGYKDLPARFSKASPDHVSGSSNERVVSGSSHFLKRIHSLDLNSTRDLNLNVSADEPNGEDSVPVLPWLRAKASNSEALQDRVELHNGCEVRNAVDHQNSVASTSCDGKRILGVPISEVPLSEEREIERGKKRVFLDINIPCDDLEEFDNDEGKIETECPNGFRNMIDLNLCITEDEIPSRTSPNNDCSSTADSTKKPERGIIDLEAPVDLEDEEENNCVPDQELPLNQDEDLAKVAAEAIVALSTSNPPEQTHNSEDTLCWFVDIACSSLNNDTDRQSSDSDSFEEMTLNQTECTVDEYFPNPPNFDSLTTDETGPANATGRARRGPSRRGRQRRDFQRDILPGLTSLARQEVTEDLQTFGGLMRATGHAWNCGTRRSSLRGGSGRGRRRAVAVAAVIAAPVTIGNQLLKSGENMLEDRSLTSWGKTTRRPRRQRCPPAAAAGNPAPIPLA